MFFKINPGQAVTTFSLLPHGFIVGDRIVVDLKGDFSAAVSGEFSVDAFQNSSFNAGETDFGADNPVTVNLKSEFLKAYVNDRPLTDNSDPDGDYGVDVKVVAFTSQDDFFDFRNRTKMPDLFSGSFYNSGDGRDEIYFSNAPIAGFDTSKKFLSGAQEDTIHAAKMNMTIDFGKDVDTLMLPGSAKVWKGNAENLDRDSNLIISSGSTSYNVANLEIIQTASGVRTPVYKWAIDIERSGDGKCEISVSQNGKVISDLKAANAFYDEATPIPEGIYTAFFRNNGPKGERLELENTGDRTNIQLHKGLHGGASEGCFVPGAGSFLSNLFAEIRKTYTDVGGDIPWGAAPLVPITVNVNNSVNQPRISTPDATISDRKGGPFDVGFNLVNDGAVKGMDRKGVQIFFTIDQHNVSRGDEWDFASNPSVSSRRSDPKAGVVERVGSYNGEALFSAFITRGADHAPINIEIEKGSIPRSGASLKFHIEDISLWRHTNQDGWQEFGVSREKDMVKAPAELLLLGSDLDIEVSLRHAARSAEWEI